MIFTYPKYVLELNGEGQLRNLYNRLPTAGKPDYQNVIASVGLAVMPPLSAQDKRHGLICWEKKKKTNVQYNCVVFNKYFESLEVQQGISHPAGKKYNAHTWRRPCVAVLAPGDSSADRFLSARDLWRTLRLRTQFHFRKAIFYCVTSASTSSSRSISLSNKINPPDSIKQHRAGVSDTNELPLEIDQSRGAPASGTLGYFIITLALQTRTQALCLPLWRAHNHDVCS